MQNSPFSYNLPPAKPIVLKPLRYCEFRVSQGDFQDKAVYACEVFACATLEGMDFCDVHTQMIANELSKEVGGDVDSGNS